MAKETHTIELTLEEIIHIIKAEYSMSGDYNGEFYHFKNEEDELMDRFSFTFDQQERELPF